MLGDTFFHLSIQRYFHSTKNLTSNKHFFMEPFLCVFFHVKWSKWRNNFVVIRLQLISKSFNRAVHVSHYQNMIYHKHTLSLITSYRFDWEWLSETLSTVSDRKGNWAFICEKHLRFSSLSFYGKRSSDEKKVPLDGKFTLLLWSNHHFHHHGKINENLNENEFNACVVNLISLRNDENFFTIARARKKN